MPCDENRPSTWTPADWITWLDALSDGETPPEASAITLLDEEQPPPIEASPALVRYACARLEPDSDLGLIRRAAGIVQRHRTGDPVTDTRLFWWEARTPEQLKILRWMLELSGPAGAREELVSAAQLCGLVGPQVTMYLSAPVRRPPWADGDVE